MPSSGHPYDRRSSVSPFPDRGYHRGTQSSDFPPSPPTAKNLYVHPASVGSNFDDDSYNHKIRRPPTNWISRPHPRELISSTSSKFDSAESRDFPYDLVASSSPLAERYIELGNAFGKPHQAPARRVGRHYCNANAISRSDDDYEKSENSISDERVGVIETPSRKMVWVVYRADAEPESSIENENFVPVPTRSAGKKMKNKHFQREEPMSDSQLEDVVRRAIAAAARQHRQEDALYGRPSHRTIYSNEHQREDQEISHGTGRLPVDEVGRRSYEDEVVARSQAAKKIYRDRYGGAEIDRLPVKKSRGHFAPRDGIIYLGSTGNREIATGNRYRGGDAGIIFYGEEPEVAEREEASGSSEDDDDEGEKIGQVGTETSRSYFEHRDRNGISSLAGNRKVVTESRYRDEDAGINFYGEEQKFTGCEESSESSEEEEDDDKKNGDFVTERSRSYFAARDRNINTGLSGDRKIITGSRFGNEDAGIIFYREKPESTRLPVSKSRGYFAPQDENVSTGLTGNRDVITGSRYGAGNAGIIFYDAQPEINGRFRQPEDARRPKGDIEQNASGSQEIVTGSYYHDGDAGTVFQREKPEVTGSLGQPEDARRPDENVNPGSAGDQDIITGSRHGDREAETICYKDEPEVEGKGGEDEEKKVDDFGRENNHETEKSVPISSDRYRTVNEDGGSKKPEVTLKPTNYRTHSRSDEEVSSKEENENGNEGVDMIEESTKAPIIEKEDDREEMLGETNPDFFEDMENPPTVTEPPLRLNFDGLDASTPAPANTVNL